LKLGGNLGKETASEVTTTVIETERYVNGKKPGTGRNAV